MSRRVSSWVLAAAGLLFAGALLVVARPERVVSLLRDADPPGLAVAFAWCAGLVLLRGARLAVVLHGRLALRRATAAVAVAQFAAASLPLRLGELAFIPVLARAGLPGAVRAVSWLVLLRAMDAAALLVWAVAAAVWQGASPTAALLALVGLIVVAAATARVGGRLLLGARSRWRHASPRVRSTLRQLLTVRRELVALGRTPWRVAGAWAASFAAWAAVWGYSVAALRAVGVAWPPRNVLLAVVGASLGASLPFNAFGSFGTLEAGWAAALATAGVAARESLAPGFAVHALALACNGALALGAYAYLVIGSPTHSK